MLGERVLHCADSRVKDEEVDLWSFSGNLGGGSLDVFQVRKVKLLYRNNALGWKSFCPNFGITKPYVLNGFFTSQWAATCYNNFAAM